MNIPLFQVKKICNIEAKINELFESGRVAHGEYVTKFEAMLGAYIGSQYTLATSEMSSSIAMCLYVSGVRPGDEVLMSPLVCLATSCPVKNIFANIVWCDVNPKTGNLDPETTDEIMSLLYSIFKSTQTPIIIATHNYQLIEKYPGIIYMCAYNSMSRDDSHFK